MGIDWKKILPNPKKKDGIIQAMVVTTQAFNRIPTYCHDCRKAISFRIYKGDGSHTRICDCGCRLFQYHPPDKFHQTAFFTERFIDKEHYHPEYALENEKEKRLRILEEKLKAKGIVKQSVSSNGEVIYATKG